MMLFELKLQIQILVRICILSFFVDSHTQKHLINYIPGAIFAKDLNEKLLLWYNLYTNKEYPDPDEEENSDD